MIDYNKEFVDAHNQIQGVKFWNTNRDNHKTWETYLSIDDLRVFTERFNCLLLKLLNA